MWKQSPMTRQEVIEKAAAAAATAKAQRGPEVEKKKRMVGPGIDRGGARLANEKRRLGFIDGEDFEEVVTDSD
ncbi:putative zinc finger c2h2-type protein [Neofusicoccum parvum UCRNP2]|uniref:Putative zinc finger c2h2-type protein n=1 Tax=Botryosphaeria parva (strain UCR-NP2) TaxID=1287680 RepID=R1GK49_BOTPV|nr:putative zinc finger c2h2-type protein [Neofusicoccum parvum UCRNP2]